MLLLLKYKSYEIGKSKKKKKKKRKKKKKKKKKKKRHNIDLWCMDI